MTNKDTRTEEAAAKILHLGKMLNLAAADLSRDLRLNSSSEIQFVQFETYNS